MIKNRFLCKTNEQGIITIFAVVVMLLLFTASCNGDNKEVVVVAFDPETTYTLRTTDYTTQFSDSGITRYRAIAKEFLKFDKAKEPFSYFPEGIYVEKFDTLFNIEASLKADTAYNYEKKGLWKLIGNVRVENLEGKKFETSLLFWDQKEEKVYSDKYIRIQEDDKIITGIGFESNQNMTQYKIFNSQGVFPVSESVTTDSTQNIYGSGISYDYAYQIAHIMQRFGGLAVTDDNGTWKANFENNAGYENFLNMYKDMVDDGDNPLEADTDSMMSAGQVGITVGGPWVTAGLDTAGVDYGIGLIPQGDAGDMNSVEVIGFGITTAASDAEKEAAYKFIEWWNTQDKDGSSPALEWSLQNGFPAYTYSVQNNKEYKANKKLSAMSAANPEAPTDFIVDSNFPGINSVLSDVIPEMINSVAFGNSSVEDALAKAQKSTQKIVDKYNK